jgi:HK97 family phage major capsid protein
MLIDGRLRYGVRLKEEAEILYGGGGANAFEGLLAVLGSHNIATADNRITSPTIIDQIRVGATEVRVAGYSPDVVLIHPYDYEAVLLQKDDQKQYIGGVFPAGDGTMRVHGLRVVEVEGLEASDGSRYLIVMDSRRACALHVREELSVTIGMADDDFIRNKRRLLAEERAAFAIYAPKALAVLETQAAA